MKERIEGALERCLSALDDADTPPRLRQALRAAVFPGGARLRPRLLLTVVEAHGDPAPDLADAAAVAVELLHCSSLVHDDLPCFDDAALRRGQPTIHRGFGESTAVLVGDGLIFLAVETLTNVAAVDFPKAAATLKELMRAAGPREGLVCGQALEGEAHIDLGSYHRAKTGALFEAAAVMGALVVGADPVPYQRMAMELGLAYQIADDMLDHQGGPSTGGKTGNQDQRKGRPNAVASLGLSGAQERIEGHRAIALSHVEGLPDSGRLVVLIEHTVSRLVNAVNPMSSASSG